MSSSSNQFTKDFVRKLAHIAKKNLKIKDGDYQKNNLWYSAFAMLLTTS